MNHRSSSEPAATKTRLERRFGHRPRAVAITWLVLTLVALPASMGVAKRLTAGGYEVPGSASADVQHLVQDALPSLGSEQFVVVLQSARGTAAAASTAALTRVESNLAAQGRVFTIAPSDLQRARLAATDGARLIPVVVSAHLSWSQAIDRATGLAKALGAGETRDGVTTYLAGRGMQAAALQAASKSSLQQAETLGFPMLLALLFAIFGAFLAALLPLLVAGASLTLTGAALYGLSRITDVSVFSQNMASMIGVGVAVDYALFVLVRFREELASGADVPTARATAMRTSGTAVVMSGLTVALSLACVLIVGNAALRSMAAGAIIVVVVAVASTVTLLPALMTLLGHRLARHRFSKRPAGGASPFWARWTARVMRRPVLSAGAAILLLLAIASPLLSVRVGDDTIRQLPSSDQARQAAQRASLALGPGADAPVLTTIEWRPGTSSGERAQVLARLAASFRATSPVASVSSPTTSVDGAVSAIATTTRFDYESAAGRSAVRVLRRVAAQSAADTVVQRVAVGGAGASGVDLIDLISGKLPLLALLIVGSAFLVLLVLLRSVVLPVKAVCTNLLSVGAGYGAVVALFQWGWLGGLTGIEPLGHVQAFALPLILAVVFGLSMDYQVFLLARIRERWIATHHNERAVAEGLATTAGVISGAALIMVTVFVSFAATGIPIVQELGIGCAVAIAVDATIVRLVLVPASMRLLGTWNWWWPGRSGAQAAAPAAPTDSDERPGHADSTPSDAHDETERTEVTV